MITLRGLSSMTPSRFRDEVPPSPSRATLRNDIRDAIAGSTKNTGIKAFSCMQREPLHAARHALLAAFTITARSTCDCVTQFRFTANFATIAAKKSQGPGAIAHAGPWAAG